MYTYEFTLKFTLPDEDHIGSIDEVIERLGEGGCDDALVGIGKTGRLALDFAREASTAFEAISSAIIDIRKVIPEAKLIEATPDLVGLTDVADIVGCSRQNIRKIMLANVAQFPAPVYEGKAVLWHLSKVLVWLREEKQYRIEDELLEVAHMNMHFNVTRDINDFDPQIQRQISRLVS